MKLETSLENYCDVWSIPNTILLFTCNGHAFLDLFIVKRGNWDWNGRSWNECNARW